jgi:hypothetical protein
MSYITVEVEIDHGKVLPKEPDQLPETGRGLLTILPPATAHVPPSAPARRRVELPLIHGDGQRIINPTPDQLDGSLWD